MMGIKGKNNFRDRTIVLGLACAFTAIPVNGLKYTTKIERPNGSRKNSFPSGHTAVAFMGAEFLWQEYKDVSLWYSIAGYTIAAGTGALRMYNNKHWLGDVAAGAGFGILSTKLAYLIQPRISRMFTGSAKGKTFFVVAPSYDGEHAGLNFSIRL
ncbi:MAG: phosphatase PAP2 family protein [Bacteroides sp.]|nr:phosphatase PAP2 family protein [Bacteroides sp.]